MQITLRCLITLLAATLALTGCTPQAALIASLIPEGTLSVVLGNLEQVSDENRRRVIELERAGQWKELAAFAESNLAKDRSNADWWLIAGYARSQLREYRAAADAYGTAVRLEPDVPAGWHLLAQSHRAAGEPHRAVNALNNALLALRDSPLTWFLLGESYIDLRRDDEAAAAYRGAVKAEPRFPAAWYKLALAYTRLGRAVDAQSALAQLEKLDPKLASRLKKTISDQSQGAR